MYNIAILRKNITQFVPGR